MDRLKKAHELVLLAAKGGTPVYGLTVGVGLNKDKPLSKQTVNSPKKLSKLPKPSTTTL